MLRYNYLDLFNASFDLSASLVIRCELLALQIYRPLSNIQFNKNSMYFLLLESNVEHNLVDKYM